nr:NADH dehydrogenase subunit 3 [Wallacea dactyliferae]
MKLIFNLLMIITAILIILITILNLVSKKTFFDKEKNSPFECGFDPKFNARIPFSIQFFLIAILFLIFDVEITLILPMIKMSNQPMMMEIMFSSSMIIIILISGLIHEWKQGALKWLK